VPIAGIDGSPGNRALVLGGTQSGRCVIMDSGKVECWGSIRGSTIRRVHNYDVLPVAGIDGTPGNRAIAISQGAASTVCVVLDTGRVRCWGGSQYGPELGNGTAAQSDLPVEVLTGPSTPLTEALVR